MSDDFTSGDIAAAASGSAPAEASPAAAQPTSTPSTPAATVPGEGSGSTTATTEDARGPMPYDRHEAVLTKTRREYDEKLARVSWAERYDRDKVERALQLADRRERDPRGLYEELTPLVKTPEKPQPDLITEDGRRLYSDAQADALVQFKLEQALAERDKKYEARFGPIEQREASARSAQQLESQIATAAEWPGFMDHLDAVTEAVTEANRTGRKVSLESLYIQIVVPKLTAALTVDDKTRREQESRRILDEMNQTSATVRGEVNPGRTPSARHKADKDKSFKELIAESVAAAQSR